MGEAGTVVIALMIRKNLGFVFKPSEGIAINDAVSIALELGSSLVLRLLMLSTSTFR